MRKERKNMIIRKSESTVYPEISYRIEDVLVPSNIETKERVFEDTKETIYAYDETVYTLAEWQALKDLELSTAQDALNFLIMGGI